MKLVIVGFGLRLVLGKRTHRVLSARTSLGRLRHLPKPFCRLGCRLGRAFEGLLYPLPDWLADDRHHISCLSDPRSCIGTSDSREVRADPSLAIVLRHFHRWCQSFWHSLSTQVLGNREACC